MTKYLPFTLLFFFLSCKSGKEEPKALDLRPYYYPLEKLTDGLVYEYIDENTGQISDYWLFRLVKDDAGDKFLISAGYNAKGEQTQYSREWVVANGTILKDYKFYTTDSTSGKSIVSETKIEENIIFPFSPTKDSTEKYRLRLIFSIFPDTALKYDMVKDRYYAGDTLISFLNQKEKVAHFKAREYFVLEDKVNGGHWKTSSEIDEFYAQNIGLVYSYKKVADTELKRKLNKILSVEEFNARFEK